MPDHEDCRLDLFGDPIPENHGRRGRPAHVPTAANRDKVNLLLAFGWGNERIANAIGISEPTLRRSYKRELKIRLLMRDRLDARLAEKLMAGVNEGNVGAIKEFRKLLEHNDRMTAEASFKSRAAHRSEPAAKDEKLGKKAQRIANAEARTSEGRYAVPSAPRLVQ